MRSQLLPIGMGDYQYVAPGGGRAKRIKGDGYEDDKGNRWEWARSIGPGLCEHWDVQHPNGDYSNIRPDGTVHHGSVHEEYF